ncbi:uncharacterized protein DS421_11g347330 [Arachis hypogaea]|nr:uncharacterized protein DS421_11g347330 [Arachis hypogaea]
MEKENGAVPCRDRSLLPPRCSGLSRCHCRREDRRRCPRGHLCCESGLRPAAASCHRVALKPCRRRSAAAVPPSSLRTPVVAAAIRKGLRSPPVSLPEKGAAFLHYVLVSVVVIGICRRCRLRWLPSCCRTGSETAAVSVQPFFLGFELFMLLRKCVGLCFKAAFDFELRQKGLCETFGLWICVLR